MIDVSGFGTGIIILALQSFPMGFKLEQFADDVDPISAKEVEAIGFDMMYDGELFAYDQAAAIEVSVSVVPGTPDDINLKILLQSKKGAAAILPLPDITSMVINYPDGGRVMLTKGTILRGPLVDSIVTTGRRKGNTYTFAFGAFAGAQSATQLVAGIGQGLLDVL